MRMGAGQRTVVVLSPAVVRPRGSASLAARPGSLQGLRLAFLDNNKGNADALLAEMGRRLAASDSLAAVRPFHKDQATSPATEEVLADMRRASDLALVGVGD
jgi:hypothetical protein